jgi:hypothetical protein
MRFLRQVWLVIFCVGCLARPGFAQKLSWTWSNPLPHGNDIVGMAWNGTLGVQVCELGRVYTSPDLINWYSQNSSLTNDLQAVTFFGSRILITGANGAIAYSDDGVNFTNCSVSTTNWLVSVAASSKLAVAVGDNGVIYISTNGAKWYLQSPPPNLAASWLTSVAYGNGVFVTTGDQGFAGGESYLANSSDGIHWTNQTPSFLSSFGNLEAVAWVNTSGSTATYPYTGFWAVDDAGHAIYSTNNGVVWNKFLMLNSTNVLYTVAADNFTGLLAGDSEVRLGSFSVSSNRVVWPEQTGQALTSVPPWTYFAAVSQTNGVYELAGYDGMLVQSSVTNGNYYWNTPYDCARDWLWQVTLANGLYVAVGDNARIMTSSDGADWTVESFTATNSIANFNNSVLLCVGGNSNLLVAAGNQGSLVVSPNFIISVIETNSAGSLVTNSASSLGVAWYALSAPSGTTNDFAGVCTFSNKFYLVAGNGLIYTLGFNNWPSLNPANVNALLGGGNWSTNRTSVTNDLSGITVFTNSVFTNGILVVCGDQGKILISTNGTSWTNVASGVNTGLLRVHCFNGRLLVVGENGTLLTSTNATTWTSVASGVTNWLNDAIMVSNTCYAVGNQGVVLTSTNFTSWTSIGTITTESLDGVATQNGQLIVVGYGGMILRSQIVPVTTPVMFTDYQQSSGYNIYTVVGTVDELFTFDSSTNLLNWVTGPVLDLIYGDGTLIFYQSLPTNPPATQFYRCTPVP